MIKTIYAKKMLIIAILTLILILVYQFIFVDMDFLYYAMYIRTPKLIAMIIASFCIGCASIVFQSIINNRIVTPCLLGMNALYILVHTSIAFVFGVSSVFLSNKNISFTIDIVLMSFVSTMVYSFLFRKTKYNILYVLLSGTVMATLFRSISNTLIRTIDPNEYDVLQASLIAGFSDVNSDIILMSVIIIIFVIFIFRKEIKLLDVITLGKNQSINLGVDYDKTISKLLLGVTLFITVATALVGPISFLGLIIANLSRELFKTYRHSYLMMGSFLIGVIVLVFGQILIEHVFSFNTVISVFINLFGGIYFLYLILKNKGM